MRLKFAIIALVIGVTLVAGVAADEPPVAYRRVFVPAENPAAWPRGQRAYLPVEKRDFDEWVAAANATPAAATITTAHYEARIVAGELQGSGAWHVELMGTKSARIELSDRSLALHNARWRGDESMPVRLGWWPVEGPVEGSDELKRSLEVSRTGDLEFEWCAPAISGAAGAPEYLLPTATAARTQFVLDLPAGQQPVFTRGVILESPSRPGEGGRWVVALPPQGRATLQIRESGAAPTPTAASTKVHQELHYHLSQRGTDLRATLHLDAGEPGVQQLRIVLPKDSRLVEASDGERQLQWRTAEGTPGAAPAETIIELGDIPLEQAATLTLRCWGPPIGGEHLKLPMLTVVDTFWLSGVIRVAIDDALSLGELTPVDCIQTAVDSVITDQGPARQMSFTALAPSASVEVVLTERRARGLVQMGTSLEVGNPRITARTVADVTVEQGSLRRLTAALLPGWSIDAVETIPSDVLGEWNVDRSRAPQVLDLQLHQAVTPDRPVQIHFSGRFERSGAVAPLSISQLNPLSWNDLSTKRSLLQLQASEQFELEVASDLQYVDASTLSPSERTLFAGPYDAPLCDLAVSPPASAIRLVPKKGAYDATIQVDADLRQGRLRRNYRVECRPRGGGVEHVLVYLSQPSPHPLEWFESDSDARLPAERMPETDPRLGGLPRGGELWLVDLGHLYARPFAITAHSTEPWSRRDRVPLVALPDAASQQGRVAVSSTAVELPTIVAEGMSPTSLPVESPTGLPDDSTAVRAVYRFQPARFYDASPAAQLWIGPAASTAGDAELIATRVEVESRYAADGSGVHRANYRVQNIGRKSLELALPDGVKFEAVRVDGEPVTVVSPHKLALTLPQRSEFDLELALTSRQLPLDGGQRLPAPLPTGALAICAGHWRVCLPHGFERADDLAPPGAAQGWRERWFGPLARRQFVRPFNPIDARDWNAIWAGLSRAVSTPALAEPHTPERVEPLPTGWHTVDLEFVVGPPAAILLAHRPATSAIGLALFLVCVVVPGVFHLRGLTILLLAVAAAAMSICLPELHASLGAAATLGFSTAALWHVWQRMSMKNRAVLAAVVTFVACLPVALADGPPAAIESVLVPVDASGQSSGTKFFVSSDFLRTLIQRATSAVDAPWFLLDMRCDGELLPEQESQAGLRAANWTLTFEIETFTRDAEVRLPLRKDDADWLPTASVDGIPLPIAWRASGRECMIRIAEPGRKRVSLSLVPRIESVSGRQSIALVLPKIPGATVSITAPAGLSELRGEERPYERHAEANRVVWRRELDDSGRLVATWNAPVAEVGIDAKSGVDQLCSLQIEPTELRLTTKLRRPQRSGWPSTIELTIDDHWELMSDSAAARIVEADSLPAGRKLLRVRTGGFAEQREINLRFRSTRASALGRVLVPNVQPISPSAGSRFVAVAWDEALECTPSFTPPATAAPPAELAQAAAAGGPARQMLFDASKVEPHWYLTVRPRDAESTCEDRLALAASKRQLRVAYRCVVEPQAADRFGWSLAVPEQLDVERVAVTCGDESVPIDWTRPTPARLAIHFEREVAEPYEVELTGFVPLVAGVATPVPRIAPFRLPQATQLVALYRDENTLAQWQQPRETQPAEYPAGQSSPFGELVRFVGAQRITAESAADSHIVVEANRPVVNGDTMTVVTRHDDTWKATFHAELRVDRGVVDVLRLQAPANWVGPFVVTPAATARGTSATGDRALVIRLPRPVPAGQSIRLSVDSPLAVADGEVPVAPRIQLAHVGKRREFFAVPASVGGQQATWTQRGVEPAELPPGLREASIVPTEVETFRVTADSINVALRPRSKEASAANVRLAETAVRAGAGGGQIAITRFVVSPEGIPHCTVKLPEGAELVRLQLDGHAVLARSLDPQTWQVQLGPPDLPQVLEVVTRVAERSAAASRAVSLRRPKLEFAGEELPVEFGLWTLRRVGATGAPRVTGGSLVTPAALAAARFDRLLSISQSATRSIIESPLVDGYHWFARWSVGLEAAARAAGALERQVADASAAIRVPQRDQSLAETEARYDAWLDQINELFAAAEWNATLSPVAASSDPWSEFAADLDHQVCFISDGKEHHASVEFVAPGMTRIESRTLLLVSLASVAAAAVWLARRPWRVEIADLWPETVGLAGGLIAWAWLRPSVLGFAVVVVCAALVARRMIRARKSPRHDSSNQPSESAERMA